MTTIEPKKISATTIEIERHVNGFAVTVKLDDVKVRSAWCKDQIEVKDWLLNAL